MEKNKNKSEAAALRKKAEALLKNKSSKHDFQISEVENFKLIHELQVHQIELELQNEELQLAKDHAEIAAGKYTTLYEFAPSGFFSISDQGEIVDLNLSGALMLGKDRTHLRNSYFDFSISPDSRPVFNLFLKKIFKSNSKESCEVTLETSGNQPVFVHLSGIATESGSQCLVTMVDVTEHRQTEIALQQSKVKYRQLAENSATLVYRILLKPAFKFDYVSPSAAAITGYTPGDHYADPQLGFKLVHPDDRILLENTTRYSKGEPLELRWIRKDGRVIWTEQRNVLLFDKNNEPYAIEGSAIDITDRKNAELGLRKEAERNSLLLDLFANATSLTDKELYDKALDIAVKITDSKIGFCHQVSDNQQEIILTTWNDEARKNCTAFFDNHYPLDKAGNWADCIRQKRAVVYNDYSVSPNQKGLPEGHAHVGRTLSIPVVREEKVRLIFGVGNKPSVYTDLDVIQMEAVASELHKILEKREVEKDLQKSEERWHFAIEGSNDGIWDWNLLTGEVFFSIRWKEMIGYQPDEIAGKLDEWTARVHPDDLPGVMENLEQHCRGEIPQYNTEHRIRCKDGSWKWIIDRGKVLEWTAERKPARMFGTHTDITERKIAEGALMESEVQYRNLANAGLALIWTSGTDKLCNYFNETWLKFTGRTLAQEMGNGWAEGVHPEDFDRCLETYITAFDKHEPFEMEYRLQHSSGEYRWLLDLGTPNYDKSGEFKGYIGHCFDISERKNAENVLNETLSKLYETNLYLEKRVEERTQELHQLSNIQQAILRHAGLAIISTSTGGTIELFNKAAEEMLGYKADEVIGVSTPALFHDPEELSLLAGELSQVTGEMIPADFSVFQTILKRSLNQTGEWSYVRKGGDKFPVKLTISSVKDSEGRLLGYIGIAMDNTKEKLALSALRESEERFHNMFWDHSAVMILVDPETGEITEANKAAEQFYGISFKSGRRLLISDINALSPDQIKEEMANALLQDRNYFVFPHKLASGEIRTVEVHSSPINVKGSKVLFSVIHDITKRKELETALKMQSAAFESFALTIIITDIEGRIQWVNTAFTKLTGYAVDEAIGKRPGELVKSGKQDKDFYKKFWDTILSKKVWKGELVNRRKDGTLYHEEETITPVLDSHGNISSFIAIKIDITERKQLYQELADEKRRFADIIKGTNAGTWEWNIQTGETIYNEQWAGIIGYTLDEISPSSIETWIKVAHPDDLKASGVLLEQHFKGEIDFYAFESRMRHKNGEWVWVWDRGRVHEWDSEGKPLLMSGTHQDITERKKAENELQWNKSFLELMSNSSPLGFLVIDNRTDNILYFNHRFCEIWEILPIEDQMQRGELKNNDIIPYCLPVLADIPAFAESCKPLQHEANRIVVEDEIAFTENRTVRRFSTQIRGENDEYFGRFYIFEDITERKRAEGEIRKARNEAEKANLAKSEFLSRMSHELRTPMNSILGFGQLLELGELNPKQKKGVTHILNNGKHLLDLINEVLDISGIEAGRQTLMPEPVHLAAIINEMTDSIQIAAKNRKVSFVLADSPANGLYVLADRLRLKQVLINLFNNAIKYNKEGGSVTVKTALQPSGEPGTSRVRISISDTGTGISPVDFDKLFQPFERLGANKIETEGTGLGLMVVKKLTEAMGGKVGVESVVGTGSTFWIELPQAENIRPDTRQATAGITPGLHVTRQTATILYIEDNLPNLDLIEEIIVEYRPEIRLVTSMYGKETVRLANEYKPGLILLDLDLPDISGLEVLEQLMADADLKAIPVIIISADAMPLQVEKLMKAGAKDYLTKPLDVGYFLKTIDSLISR